MFPAVAIDKEELVLPPFVRGRQPLHQIDINALGREVPLALLILRQFVAVQEFINSEVVFTITG